MNSKTESGYTLIEVLVALAIISVALMAILQTLQLSTQGARRNTMRSLALHTASNLMAEIKLQGQFPSPGIRHTPCPIGHYEFVCEVQSKATEHSQFRQITIRVQLDKQAHNHAYLHGILMRRS
ncbi:type II secretion system minor pseudopilin GspI [Alcaligenes endophyticus]|uniref:Type II secretion system protein I n=1 Tax=Alcaligenes endophyticus TaxID=1929088 RepID=A0ABT8EGK1_9BURK|nr:type II secretion system minor pseudopilin GspI [Alcaligenes endophyticus]MCX5589919.1 type II secretion system minor pseudopilin GspI [Alcaligenes endophyticus]MDN4120418.1 type II secretion system minor pseudopilin GspI [Alcaligenes endophyticus]